jgi:hypothetical protein
MTNVGLGHNDNYVCRKASVVYLSSQAMLNKVASRFEKLFLMAELEDFVL